MTSDRRLAWMAFMEAEAASGASPRETAADELRLDHHAFDPGRRAFHHDLAQVVVLLDPHLPHDGVEPEVAIGQTMIAGESVIARLQGPQVPRLSRME